MSRSDGSASVLVPGLFDCEMLFEPVTRLSLGAIPRYVGRTSGNKVAICCTGGQRMYLKVDFCIAKTQAVSHLPVLDLTPLANRSDMDSITEASLLLLSLRTNHYRRDGNEAFPFVVREISMTERKQTMQPPRGCWGPSDQ